MANWPVSTLAQVMPCSLTAPGHPVSEPILTLARLCSTHLKPVSQRMSRLLICIMLLKIISLQLLPHLPGTNELSHSSSIQVGGDIGSIDLYPGTINITSILYTSCKFPVDSSLCVTCTKFFWSTPVVAVLPPMIWWPATFYGNKMGQISITNTLIINSYDVLVQN